MFGKFIDWLLGVKREPQSYPYHRHRAWEEREEVGPDYLHPRDIERLNFSPERVANYKPIIRIGYGHGFGIRQVEMWVWRKQRIAELRYRAARRKYLRETWGWMDLPIREVMDLWPRSGLASL